MDVHHRKPEDYFDELLNSIEKANRFFRKFDELASEHAPASNPEHASKFIDIYSTHFHASLTEILNTIGALKEDFYYHYNYDDVDYRLMQLEHVMQTLQADRDLYIARIKEATAFVPQPTLKAWVDRFEKMRGETDTLQEEFESMGAKKE